MTEAKRFELHQKLDELLGSEVAATLMEHLPPVGWADVATKRDLEPLATKEMVAELRTEMQSMRADLQRDVRVMVMAIVGTMSTLFVGSTGLILHALG